MKYRNKETGAILEARSEIVEKQLAIDKRFEEYTGTAGDKPITRMNKDELLTKAAELGLTVPDGASNDDIRELIKAASGQ